MSVFRILFIAAGLQLVGLALVLAIGGFFGFRGEQLGAAANSWPGHSLSP